MLNVEFLRTKFIPELRSGNHKQIFGRYSNYYGGCCSLGLLKKLADPLDINGYYRVFSNLGVLDNYKEGGLWDKLYKLNDVERKSFSEIADWLESHLNELP